MVPVQLLFDNWLIPIKIFKPKKADISARLVENCWLAYTNIVAWTTISKKSSQKKGRKNLWGQSLWQGPELVLKASTFTWLKLYFRSTRHSKWSPFWLVFALSFNFTDVYVGFVGSIFKKSKEVFFVVQRSFSNEYSNLCHHQVSFHRLEDFIFHRDKSFKTSLFLFLFELVYH